MGPLLDLCGRLLSSLAMRTLISREAIFIYGGLMLFTSTIFGNVALALLGGMAIGLAFYLGKSKDNKAE